MVSSTDVEATVRTALLGSIMAVLLRLFGVLDVNPVIGPVVVGTTIVLYLLAAVLSILWWLGW